MVETEGVTRRHTADFKSSLGVGAAGDAQSFTDVFTGIFLHYRLNHQRSIVNHWEPTVVVVCKHQLLQQPVQYINWSMNVGRGCHGKWLIGWLTDWWMDGSVDRWIDGRMNGWKDGSIHPLIHPSINQSINQTINQPINQLPWRSHPTVSGASS